jgi:hypothetical protein
MIGVKTQGERNHGLVRRLRRAAGGTVLAALLLCLPLAGCSSPEEPHIQRVAFCQGSSSDNPRGDPFSVELRQGSTVVARGIGSIGTAFTFEVPVGGVQIYVDGVKKGAVDEGVPTDGPYRSPAPDEITYMRSGEGCPDSAPM